MAELIAPAGPLRDWEVKWREHLADMKDFGSDVSYEQSVARFRKLVASGLLRNDDIRENPDRFILAHRILSELATSLGPGFWIRFTVHFNLFSGTVVALGTPEQVAQLSELQAAGKVGCFGLTEVFAGVNSGLIVNTTCNWDPDQQCFRLHSPDDRAHKNWISQGLVGDVCVAVADLRVGGKSFGPHAFMMELRQNGKLVEGVEVGDMGYKTIGNDLDNAWIRFTDVRLPKSSLLSRYGYIDGNQYVQTQKGIRTMDMIGQRLFTGRTVIARASLVFARELYKSTRHYTDNKPCWAPKGGKLTLTGVPQLKAQFEEAEKVLTRLEAFVEAIEQQLTPLLREDKRPPTELVEAIAAAKVKCVETSIDLCWRLKQEVGSYALMAKTGFERLDFLQCCKFAEGDTRILMQKISRDSIGKSKKGVKMPDAEARLVDEIVALGNKGDTGAAQIQGYNLAHLVIDRIYEGMLAKQARM